MKINFETLSVRKPEKDSLIMWDLGFSCSQLKNCLSNHTRHISAWQ